MMSAKMVTLGCLKIKIFCNKYYDVIVSVHDFTNKFLSRDSNHVVDVVMQGVLYVDGWYTSLALLSKTLL